MDNDARPISLFTVDEIMEELNVRFPVVLLVTYKSHNEDDNDMRILYSGGAAMALGLAHAAALDLGAASTERTTHLPGGQEE